LTAPRPGPVAKAVAALAGAVALWLGGTALMLWATLEPDERGALAALLTPRLALLLLSAMVALAAAATLLGPLVRRWVVAPRLLLEQARVLVAADATTAAATAAAAAIDAQPDATLQGLATAIGQLAAQRAQLRADIAQQVREASRGIEQERSRLAALMAELTQAVVVCNLDGRILLYNASARTQMRALSTSPAPAGGAELVGLGRSIYALFDRALLAHALEGITQQLQRGAAAPSAQLLTATAAGQWLRLRVAPVRAVSTDAPAAGAEAGAPALGGFVLMLDNVTREFEQAASREQLLLGLTEGSRASLGNLQAAVEMLEYVDLDSTQRERFLAVVRDEVGTMTRRLHELAAQAAAGQDTRWLLEDMLGRDLVDAAQRRLATLPLAQPLRVATDEVDPALWLKVDSYSLLQALAYLACRLAEEYDIRLLQLRLAAAASSGAHAHLDLLWTGQAMSTETVMSWETDAMRIGQEASALTVRDVVQRHGGEFWFERERVRHQAFFRFLLPLAEAQSAPGTAATSHHDSRPEYYDFDLFQAAASGHALDERPLAALTYTVFDTETTGLDPAQGDQIIQIGATRIVNGKLLRQESFEQLVDPQRSLPAAGIAIHGIQPEMLVGQPTIEVVLPAFHAFAQDTVLVAHNAAFDMRFLQLLQARTGLRFDQPVLDTLLLSAVAQPSQESHSLEAIAERLGVDIVGRHTALGDALVTAEVLRRLIPLLAERGIVTLGQAREAAQKTFYARIKY
jgi:DNA polymerase III subunit epsilon